MTKATPVPHSPRPTEPAGAPPAEHELFPSALSADEEDDSSARASDNGGGTSGNHGNGTAG